MKKKRRGRHLDEPREWGCTGLPRATGITRSKGLYIQGRHLGIPRNSETEEAGGSCSSPYTCATIYLFQPFPCSHPPGILKVFTKSVLLKNDPWDFPSGPVVKNPPANAGDMVWIPDRGRSHMQQSNQACVLQLSSLCSKDQKPQVLKPPCPGAHVLQQKAPR